MYNNDLFRKLVETANRIMTPKVVDEANYELKNGKVLITKAEYKKVHKDFKGKFSDGSFSMLVNDPKTGGSKLVAVDFVNEAKEGKLVKTVDTLTGQYGKNRVTAGYEIKRGEGAKVVDLKSFDSVEDALLALRKIPKNWTSRWYTLGNQRYTETKAEYVEESTTEELEEAKNGKISGKVAFNWLKNNRVWDVEYDYDSNLWTYPPAFDQAVQDYRGSGPGLDAFINIARKHGGKINDDGWGWISAARRFYEKVLVPAAQSYADPQKTEEVDLEEAKGLAKRMGFKNTNDKTLAKWLRARLDKARPEDDIMRDELVKMLKALEGSVSEESTEELEEGAEKDTKGDKKAYQAFFQKTLKKYGAKSPGDLSDAEKKKFYDEIDAGWKADDEKPEKNEEVDLEESVDAQINALKKRIGSLKSLLDKIEKGSKGRNSKSWEQMDLRIDALVKELSRLIMQKIKNESVDLEEAKGDLAPARKSDELKGKGKDLETYAKKHGGVDKADMLAVAKMLQKGDESGALKFATTLDTDPRDYILSLIYTNLDEAKSLFDIKPNSKQWTKAKSRVELKVGGAGDYSLFGSRGISGPPAMVVDKGSSIWIHPFDGDRYVATLDKSNPGSYFFMAKHSIDESKKLRDFADIVDAV